MKVFLFLALTICSSIDTLAQSIPKNTNTIIVRNIGFNEICSALLDFKYAIDKMDSELQTVRTEAKKFPKYWNATYILNIRVKDSVAILSGTLTAADGGLWKDEPIYFHANNKGEAFKKSLFGYPFSLMNEFAISLNKPVEYEKR